MFLFSIPPTAHVWLLDLQPGNSRSIPQTPGLSGLEELIRPGWIKMLVAMFSYFFEVDVIMCDTLMVGL